MAADTLGHVFVILIILAIAFVFIRFITVGLGSGIGGSTTNRYHTAHQSGNYIGAKNWTPCRICKQPVNTDSYDVADWFCTSCIKTRETFDKDLHKMRGQYTSNQNKIREMELQALENSRKKDNKGKTIIEWNKDGSMKK